jgi:integrating conjugative element protein (TIGR03761 family)
MNNIQHTIETYKIKDELSKHYPGLLKQSAELSIETNIGKELFIGANNGPVGIFKFAAVVKKVWNASHNDDPYADMCLLNIYEGFIKLRKRCIELNTFYQSFLEKHKNLELKPLRSEEPIRVSLQMSTPYAYLGVLLVIEIDKLVCTILSTKYAGLLPSKDVSILLAELKQAFRKVMSLPFHWRPTGITREAILKKTSTAHIAEKYMGKVDQVVLMKELAVPYVG